MSVYIGFYDIHMSENCISCQIESVLALSLIELIQSWNKFQIFLIKQNDDSESQSNIKLKLTRSLENFKIIDQIEPPVEYCKLPVYYDNQYYCIAGLCSFLRQITKESGEISLLGFRENSLSSCAETSSWTKFCEIDIISCVKNFFQQNDSWLLEFKNLESKLNTPLKIHNKKNTLVLNTEHRYCGSLQFSLPDVIVYICVHIIHIHVDNILDEFPSVRKWYNLIQCQKTKTWLEIKQNPHHKMSSSVNDIFSGIQKVPICDTTLTKGKKARKFIARTKDAENFLINIPPNTAVQQHGFGYGNDILINEKDIPFNALPESGDLPQKRVNRKNQQLFSIAKAVIKISSPNDVIVDFCCGGGHLGLLIAFLLPHCRVILLDNKPQSLARAHMRAQKLKLTNVHIVQSNIDYFIGHFQVGVCLHACGVASDLVMQICVQKNAAMVVSPCCYGKIKTCHTVSYPRSQWLKSAGISSDDHHLMSHCADRENPDWMNWIDADRLEWTRDHNYNVFLGKLTPLDCTPKNNLLVASKSILIDDNR